MQLNDDHRNVLAKEISISKDPSWSENLLLNLLLNRENTFRARCIRTTVFFVDPVG